VPDQAGQLGQPEDALAGQVADVRDAGEQQHVMLAQGPERDGTGQHQLVVALVVGEGGEPERPGGKQLRVGAGHPGRGGPPLLAVQVDPERGQEVRGGPLRRVQVHPAPFSVLVHGRVLVPRHLVTRVRGLGMVEAHGEYAVSGLGEDGFAGLPGPEPGHDGDGRRIAPRSS
jgi:hypothetical protein